MKRGKREEKRRRAGSGWARMLETAEMKMVPRPRTMRKSATRFEMAK